MRVCMIGSFPPPIGGVSTLCTNLCQELVREGADLHFIDTGGRVGRKTVPKGVNTYFLTRSKWQVIKYICLQPGVLPSIVKTMLRFQECLGISEVYFILRLVYMVLELNSRYGLDVIHSYHALERSLAVLIVGRYLRKPVVVTILGGEFIYAPVVNRYLPLMQYILKEADSIIAISEFTRAAALKIVPDREIKVIYLGVDSDGFRPQDVSALQRKYSLENSKVILYVGHLADRKGPTVLLQAIPHVNTQYDVRYLFIGPDSGEKSNMTTMIGTLEIGEKVRIIGEVGEEQLPLFYSIADILVFPTVVNTEGFGLVALEAMASETPVIASRIAAIPEVVVDGVTGILFEPGNHVELARKIEELLANENVRQRMGREGRKLVESKFTWESCGRRTLNIYRSCTQR